MHTLPWSIPQLSPRQRRLLVGLVTALCSQLYLSAWAEGFRVSAAAILYPILLVTLMGWICRKLEKPASAAPAAPAAVPQRQAAANGGEVLAAISAAIAEELGTDVSAIRITSIKRV